MQPAALDVYYNYFEHATCYFLPRRHDILKGSAKTLKSWSPKFSLSVWTPLSLNNSAGETHLNPLMWACFWFVNGRVEKEG